jgi:hypothetical protein
MKKFGVIVIALLVTISAAIYQRLTGPTHPKAFTYTVENETFKSKVPRSGDTDKDTRVVLNLPISAVATLYYKKFRVEEEFTPITFSPIDEKKQEAFLPKMPSAAKLEYYIEILDGGETKYFFKETPIIIRYKDPVPIFVLIPHILIMFLAMLFSNLAGIQALIREPRFKRNTLVTLILMFLGGLILGPIVQKYAFGEFWTGFPFGFDLTDNKTLIAFLTWLVAYLINRKQDRPSSVIFAAVVTLVVFSIPHSLFGSELNYETGKIMTGFIQTMNIF